MSEHTVIKTAPYNTSTFFYFGTAGILSTFYYLFLQQKIGLTLTEVGSVTSFGALFSLASQPLLGQLFSRCSHKKTFIKVYLSALAGVLLLMLIVNESSIFLFAVLYGIIAVPVIGTYEIYIELLAVQKGFDYSKVRKWGSIGMGVISLLGGTIISLFSFRAFHLLGILFLLVCLGIIHKRFADAMPVVQNEKLRWKAVFEGSKIKKMYLICFLGMGSYVGCDFAFSSYLATLCKDPQMVGQVFSFSTGTKIFMEFVFFIVIARFGQKLPIKIRFLAVFGFSALRFFCISTGILPIVIMGDLLHCIVFPLFLGTIFGYLRAIVSGEYAAGCYSIIAMLMFGLSNFIYPTVFSVIEKMFGYQTMYLSNSVLGIAAMVLGVIWLPSVGRK